MKLTIKNVKTMRGHDGMPGGAWECDLYIDGIKAAYVQDDSWGGPIRFEWIRKDLEAPFKEYCQNLPHLMDSQSIEIFGPEGMAQSPDMVVEGLVSDFEQNKQIKRWCKTKLVFRVKGDKEGSYRTLKAAYNVTTAAYVRKHYPQLEEILNERFL